MLTREAPSGAVAATLSAAFAAAAAMAVVRAAKTTREVAMNYTSGIQNFSDKNGEAGFSKGFTFMMRIAMLCG